MLVETERTSGFPEYPRTKEQEVTDAGFEVFSEIGGNAQIFSPSVVDDVIVRIVKFFAG